MKLIKKNVSVIIEARLNSSRFPRKLAKKILGKFVISHQIKRLKKSKEINNIILASPSRDGHFFKKICKIENIQYFGGDENNVLKRVYLAAKKFNSQIIVRCTGDCPLIDPKIIDQIINKFKKSDVDFMSNTLKLSYPDGMDVSIFTIKKLKYAFNKAKTKIEKENITKILREDKNISKKNMLYDNDFSDLRLTLDEEEDFNLIKNIYEYFYSKKNMDFSLEDILKYKSNNPEIFNINKHIKRNMGSKLNFGQKKWITAKNTILGGNMLLSKKPERILPERWPVYYKKAKGSYVWDLENNKYLDIGLMGVGTNILGYSNNQIDRAVSKAIFNGNMSSLNCIEEVELSKKLLSINPWAGMVKFARTGGEANAMAVRIARAAAKNKNIAVCGYHGWHDWYLAANIESKKALNNHLMKGLNPIGVPSKLKSTIFPFEYNDFKKLKKLVEKNKIGIIKMEVARSFESPSFLRKIRKFCNQKNILLIFDECTSGFRETFGGLHLKYKVNPDIAVYGKALGNGYAITSVVGKSEIMKKSSNSFISSTFWTERIGPAAALKTLEIMEKKRSWEKITKKGKYLRFEIKKLIKKNNLKIELTGITPIIRFKFNYENPEVYKTYFAQEFLKEKILTTDLIFVSITHNKENLKKYLSILNKILKKIKINLKKYRNINHLLEVPVAEVEFGRLN